MVMKTWNQLFQTVKTSHKNWNELNIRKLQHFPNCAGWIASLTEGSQVSWQNSGNGSKNPHAQRSFLVATASEQMSPCYLWHTPVLCISLGLETFLLGPGCPGLQLTTHPCKMLLEDEKLLCQPLWSNHHSSPLSNYHLQLFPAIGRHVRDCGDGWRSGWTKTSW